SRADRRYSAARAYHLCKRNRIRTRAGCIVEDVCEKTVVEDTITRANDGFIVAEDSIPESRRVSHSDARSKVVPIAYLWSCILIWKSTQIKSREANAAAVVQRWKQQGVFWDSPVLIPHPQVHCEIGGQSPGVLY